MFARLKNLFKNSTITIGLVGTVLIVLVAIYAISYGLFALVGYGICWAFGWTFSFKTVFGVWLIVVLVEAVLGSLLNPR